MLTSLVRFSKRIMTALVNKTAHPFERAALDGLLIKRFFYCPAFEIYGGQSPAPPVLAALTRPQVSRASTTMCVSPFPSRRLTSAP